MWYDYWESKQVLALRAARICGTFCDIYCVRATCRLIFFRLSRMRFIVVLLLVLLEFFISKGSNWPESAFIFGPVQIRESPRAENPVAHRIRCFYVIWGRSFFQYIINVKINISHFISQFWNRIFSNSFGNILEFVLEPNKNRNFNFLEFCTSNFNQLQSIFQCLLVSRASF